jgi:hypothetical protein
VQALRVCVLAQPILGGEQVPVVVAGHVGAPCREAAKRCRIAVLALVKLPSLFAKVDRLEDLWPDEGAFGDDSLDADKLVDEAGVEVAGCHVVAAKVAGEPDGEL